MIIYHGRLESVPRCGAPTYLLPYFPLVHAVLLVSSVQVSYRSLSCDLLLRQWSSLSVFARAQMRIARGVVRITIRKGSAWRTMVCVVSYLPVAMWPRQLGAKAPSPPRTRGGAPLIPRVTFLGSEGDLTVGTC